MTEGWGLLDSKFIFVSSPTSPTWGGEGDNGVGDESFIGTVQQEAPEQPKGPRPRTQRRGGFSVLQERRHNAQVWPPPHCYRNRRWPWGGLENGQGFFLRAATAEWGRPSLHLSQKGLVGQQPGSLPSSRTPPQACPRLKAPQSWGEAPKARDQGEPPAGAPRPAACSRC